MDVRALRADGVRRKDDGPDVRLWGPNPDAGRAWEVWQMLSRLWLGLRGSERDKKKLEGQTGPCPASSQILTLDPIPCLSP